MSDHQPSSAAPPFAPGSRVYLAGHPERGSLYVERCARDPDGAWRVSTRAEDAPGIATCFLSAPAEHFLPCPPGWIEPPPVPAITDCGGANQLGLDLWRARMARWRAWHDAAAAAPDPHSAGWSGGSCRAGAVLADRTPAGMPLSRRP